MNEEILGFIKNGENESVEFKDHRILEHPEDLIKEMVGFSNRDGGTILIGLDDDGRFSGLTINKKDEEKIMQFSRDRCDPPLILKFRLLKEMEINGSSGNIYQIAVPKRNIGHPHALIKNGKRIYFIRVGTITREMTSDELRRLVLESADKDVVSEQTKTIESYQGFDYSKPHYELTIVPKLPHEEVFKLDKSVQEKVMNSRPLNLKLVNIRPRQHALIFWFTSSYEVGTAKIVENAQITDNGIINYAEILRFFPIPGEYLHPSHVKGSHKVHLSRFIVLTGSMLTFAKIIYEGTKVYNHPVIFRITLKNIKDVELTTDANRDLVDRYFFNKDFLKIEREINFSQDFELVKPTKSILVELCRSFGFSIEESVAEEHTVSSLRETRDARILNFLK